MRFTTEVEIDPDGSVIIHASETMREWVNRCKVVLRRRPVFIWKGPLYDEQSKTSKVQIPNFNIYRIRGAKQQMLNIARELNLPDKQLKGIFTWLENQVKLHYDNDN